MTEEQRDRYECSNARYGEHLQWNRKTQNALYYAFWVLFAGGFVYSLKLTGIQPWRVWWWGPVGFRVLAVIGIAITFMVQNRAIDEEARYQLRLRENSGGTPLQRDDHCFLRKIEDENGDMKPARWWQKEARVQPIAGAFLILAGILSFVIPVDEPAHRFERFGTTAYVLDTATGKVCNPLKTNEPINPVDRALQGDEAAKDANGFLIVPPNRVSPCDN